LLSLSFGHSPFVEELSLSERFLFAILFKMSSGVGDRFVEVTGGEEDDWISESFSLSLLSPLLVNNVIDRLIKLIPDDDASILSLLFALLLI
jgi:hypothetical protein